ncbi:MAG: YceI family protein [Flavipsychrobacter sp.]
MFCRLLIVLVFLLGAMPVAAQQVYETTAGTVRFFSNTQQELIKASSDKLQGVVDVKEKRFAFRVEIGTFLGFNNPLQRDHFNENYMESEQYPIATFTGKIVEDVDLLANGKHKLRAKGKLSIHGVEQERILYVIVTMKDGRMEVTSEFTVPLIDHSIKIPRVVYEKLATEINVFVAATLQPRQS